MTRFAVVDETGAVVAAVGSMIGACRKIAAASDEAVTWRDVDAHLKATGDPFCTSVAGVQAEYTVIPWSDVVEVDPS